MTTLHRVTTTARAAGAAAAVGLLGASCTASHTPSVPGSPASASPRAGSAASSSVLPLNKIAVLRSLFNRTDGHPRLILIFSPT
jgi:hypothetical protein